MAIGLGLGTFVLIVVVVVVMSFRVLREYQRAVVFMLGRFWKVKGPGFFLLIPVVQQMVRIDLRTVVMDVPPQDVITRDNVSVKVNAVVYFRIVDPHAIARALGPRVAPAQSQKIARNDPCPCGSGKKYKKCCGA